MGPGIYNIHAGLFPGLLIQKSLLCLDRFHLTRFTQNAVGARALGVLCDGKGLHAVTGVRKKQERRRERRLTLDEDDSNNYAAFSLEPPCSIHMNTVKRKEKKTPLFFQAQKMRGCLSKKEP